MKKTKASAAAIILALLILASATGYGVAQIGDDQRFDDVPPEHYAYEAVSWAANLGITVGCGDGSNFCPDRTLTRAEIVTFLYRYDRSVRGASDDESASESPTVPGPSVAKQSDFYTLRAAGNRDPRGIWSNGTTMWVADSHDSKIYAYDMHTKTANPTKDILVLGAAGVGYAPSLTPMGIWSDGTTMWVSISGLGDEINAYDLNTKKHDPSKSFTLLRTGNRDPRGIWSDGTTMWVADSDDAKIYAYQLPTGTREPSQDLVLRGDEGIPAPTGIWSDGTTMWVAGIKFRSLAAYDLATKTRVPAKDFTDPLFDGGDALGFATGIWSDGTTMWVASWISNEILAYDMATKTYVGDRS